MAYSRKHHEPVLALLEVTPHGVTGAGLRAWINSALPWWRRWSGPAFYKLMDEMEQAGLVTSGVEVLEVGGEYVRVWRYHATNLRGQVEGGAIRGI